MDYKALVKTVRDAGDVSAMADHETLLDSNEETIDLLGSEECLTWGMVIALCDAVEALEKDRERLEWVSDNAVTVSDGYGPDGGLVNVFDSTRGRVRLLSTTLPTVPRETRDWFRAALDAAISRTAASRVQEASTPTPAAPSDA